MNITDYDVQLIRLDQPNASPTVRVLLHTDQQLGWAHCPNPSCDAMGPYEDGYRCSCGGDGGFEINRWN